MPDPTNHVVDDAFVRVDAAEAIERGLTLPADWYTDPEVLAREEVGIFGREWQYVGHASRLDKPGAYLTVQLGRVPVVVLRDADGELAGYVNVCPHRGHAVALDSGCRGSLQCRYHGWTFGLDGRLRGAPRSDREPGFDAGAIHLRRVQVDAWGPLVFVNPDLQAPSLADTLGGVLDVARERGFDPALHPLRATREWPIRCNWKVMLDNNTECYHCATVHPGFRSEYHVDREHYRVTAFEKSFAHVAPPRRPGDGERDEDFHLYYLWPTFMASGRGRDYFYTYTYVPVDANTTLQRNDYFFPESCSDAEVEHAVEQIACLMREDWDVFERVQIGMRSGLVPNGRLLHDEERLLRHVQRLCFDAVSA
jgi:choline monooxygenase